MSQLNKLATLSALYYIAQLVAEQDGGIKSIRESISIENVKTVMKSFGLNRMDAEVSLEAMDEFKQALRNEFAELATKFETQSVEFQKAAQDEYDRMEADNG